MQTANEVFTERVLALIDSHKEELLKGLPKDFLIKPRPPYTSCHIGKVSTQGPVSMMVTGHADS